MKKLTKLQKKWVLDYSGDDDHANYLISLLVKLKVLKQREALLIREKIMFKVREWADHEFRRKMKHNSYEEEKQNFPKAPRSIKPTRARSRY